MWFFKKKEKIPEWVNCPVCGKPVKYIKNRIPEQRDRYLDGVEKISLEEYLDSHMLCESCGYIFTEQSISVIDECIAKIVFSKKYQDIFHSTSLTDFEKRVEFAKLLYNFNGANLFWDINIFLSDYYAHQNNREQELIYLEKAINDVLGGRVTVGGKFPLKYISETLYGERDPYGWFHISDEMVLVDLYRRMGQKENALKYLKIIRDGIVVDLVDEHPLMVYLRYQETLINNGITDRI